MISRRDFIRISAMASAAALINWQFPGFARAEGAGEDEYDVIVIGAGLGGLSSAAFLAMNGLRPLVIEKRDIPGGYATSFQRGDDGEFTCEVSLHGLTGNPAGMALLTQLFGMSAEQIKEAMFAPHAYSWSSRYPDNFALDIPQPLEGASPEETFARLAAMLMRQFQEEKGLPGYMQCWGGLLADIAKFYGPDGGLPEDISQFPVAYPTWASMLWEEKKKKTKTETKTLTDLFKEYKIKNPQLQAILGQSWPYYGLPPSEVPAWLYLMYTGFYHVYGNYYIKGTSQSLSNALKDVIENSGGQVLLDTEVTEILFDEASGRTVGVKTKQGDQYNEYYAKAIVSNAAVPQTLRLLPESVTMLPEYNEYIEMISSYTPSTSHFNVWLGLDLSEEDDGFLESYEKLGSNTLVYAGYEQLRAYQASLQCAPERSGFALLAYDKLGGVSHSPEGHASITISMLSDYRPWKRFETDYLAGNKVAYNAEKTRITETLISLAEEWVLPGLAGRIRMQESSTPLTNVRFTYNDQGAIYGYDQTEDNSGLTRLGNRTPVPGLYLAGAWTNPGGGFEMVMLSGIEALKCMVEDWERVA